MNLNNIFNNSFDNSYTNKDDFNLVRINSNSYVGLAKDGNIVFIIESIDPLLNVIRQRTKKISLELNVKTKYKCDDMYYEKSVHILKCYIDSELDRIVFLELCEIFFVTKPNEVKDSYMIEVFNTLTSFFANKYEPSFKELQGLYAELFTIFTFEDKFKLQSYWQSKDKMKFDFSINSKMKIEVKSTLKTERRHHFKHEQLTSEIYDIFVVSYLLREDDEGLSLFDLLKSCIELMLDQPFKAARLVKILGDVSEQRLRSMKFNKEYLLEKRRFYDAKILPKFLEKSPEGVVNAEYDCLLDNIDSIEETEIIKIIRDGILNISEL